MLQHKTVEKYYIFTVFLSLIFVKFLTLLNEIVIF